MRVLHLSHKGLPDPRIEKAAITARKRGAETYFAGGRVRGLSYPMKIFDETFRLPFNAKANVGLRPWWSALKRSLDEVLRRCKPDIVHAHNIIAARLAIEYDIPVVYDDHEYWSMEMRYRIRGLKDLSCWLIWRTWERMVVKRARAVVTVSEEIANEHRKLNRNTFTVPNLPILSEVKNLEKCYTRNRLSSVYVGPLTSRQHPFRRMDGLIDIFLSRDVGDLIVIGDRRLKSFPPIYSIGFLRHDLLLKELTKHHIGIIPWKKHPFHNFCNPNKPYEYACAGLLVLVTSDMKPVIDLLRGFCKTFGDYDELTSLLEYYKDSVEEALEEGIKTMEFAKERLIWERFEDRIFKVYKIASSSD